MFQLAVNSPDNQQVDPNVKVLDHEQQSIEIEIPMVLALQACQLWIKGTLLKLDSTAKRSTTSSTQVCMKQEKATQNILHKPSDQKIPLRCIFLSEKE